MIVPLRSHTAVDQPESRVLVAQQAEQVLGKQAEAHHVAQPPSPAIGIETL